jgi:hypothetical protein
VQVRCYPGTLQTKQLLQRNSQDRNTNPRILLYWKIKEKTPLKPTRYLMDQRTYTAVRKKLK